MNIYLAIPDRTMVAGTYFIRFTDFTTPAAFVRALKFRANRGLPIRLIVK